MTLRADGLLSGASYDFAIGGRRADFGSLFTLDSLQTDAGFELIVIGGGVSDNDFAASIDLRIDSTAIVVRGDTSLVPAQTALLLVSKPDSDGPRVRLRSDVADLDLSGDVSFEQISAYGQAWLTTLGYEIGAEIDKPLYASPNVRSDQDELTESILWASASRFSSSSVSSIQLSGPVKRLSLIQGLIPGAKDVHYTGRIDALLEWNLSKIRADIAISADTANYGTSKLKRAMLSGRFEADRVTGIRSSMVSGIHFEADSLILGGQRISSPEVHVNLSEQTGSIEANVAGVGAVDSVIVRSSFSLTDEMNRFGIERLEVQGARSLWRINGQPTLDVYSDAISVGDGALSQFIDGEDTGQRNRGPRDLFFFAFRYADGPG